MFVPAANYPTDNGARNSNQLHHHSPYSYFRNVINPNAKRGTGFDASEHYFYVKAVSNKPNPRELNIVEKKNFFLISGESFKSMLGFEISKANRRKRVGVIITAGANVDLNKTAMQHGLSHKRRIYSEYIY
jgi:hypothetical protein